MKYCMIIADGLSDEPNIRIKNQSPLEIARKPSLDHFVSKSRLGLVTTIPPSLTGNAVIANMSLLGINPEQYYSGQASLEAAHLNIPLDKNDWVFSCDLVSTYEQTLVDHRAGNIRQAEAEVLIQSLQEQFSPEKVQFYLGKGHHHLLIIRNENFHRFTTPSTIEMEGRNVNDYLPANGQGSEIIQEITHKARKILQEHEINKMRQELQENPANNIWIWGGCCQADLPKFSEVHSLSGTVISASPEIRGLAKALQLKLSSVQGMTGNPRTNYKGKILTALKALETYDFVALHIGAGEDVSLYSKDISQKVRVVEKIDQSIFRYLYDHQKDIENIRFIFTTGRYLLQSSGVTTSKAVPFAVWGSGIDTKTTMSFNEKNAEKVQFSLEGHKLLPFLLSL